MAERKLNKLYHNILMHVLTSLLKPLKLNIQTFLKSVICMEHCVIYIIKYTNQISFY